ncbi:3-hydroxyacyl-CoA dehydrogenase family protein [Halobacteriales archaeon Cl-PHB]
MDVAVLGAGPLGRDVAQVAAAAGHDVNLQDAEVDAVMDAIDVAERRLGEAVEAGTLTPDDHDTAVAGLDGTTDRESAVSNADLVLETVTTDASSLQTTLADVEEQVAREAIVAPAAGDLSVTAAAAGLRHPDRAIGLRFRDPLGADLVEIVVADQTTETTTERAESFVDSLGRAPVVVRDAPGVVSTRLALALEAEAMRLLEDSVAGVAAVDEALTAGFDHPMGPLERADRAGLDRRLETFEYLGVELGERFLPPAILEDLVASGRTGLASGEGFYVWENGEPAEPAVPDPTLSREATGPDDPTH